MIAAARMDVQTLAQSLALALTLIATAGPSFALSCVRPDPERSFARAFEAAEPYMVVHGSFAFDTTRMPMTASGGDNPNASGASLPARFTGSGLTTDGFTTPLAIPVTLDVECLGPWCGSLSEKTDQLAFLERRDDGYHLSVTACPGMVFDTPDAELLTRMQSCLSDGGC